MANIDLYETLFEDASELLYNSTEGQLLSAVGDTRPLWKVSTIRDEGIDSVADWALSLRG